MKQNEVYSLFFSEKHKPDKFLPLSVLHIGNKEQYGLLCLKSPSVGITFTTPLYVVNRIRDIFNTVTERGLPVYLFLDTDVSADNNIGHPVSWLTADGIAKRLLRTTKKHDMFPQIDLDAGSLCTDVLDEIANNGNTEKLILGVMNECKQST